MSNINTNIIKFFSYSFIEYEIVTVHQPKVEPNVHIANDSIELKDDPSLINLHSGSKVYVRKADILKIFCDKPSLYSVRLALLIFGEKTMSYSSMPDDHDRKYPPLNEEILESIISKS